MLENADWLTWRETLHISLGRIAVGAPGDDRIGSVYLFGNVGGAWIEEAKLNASDAADHNHFGSSVAIDGTTLLVGARDDQSNGFYAGSGYLFRLGADGWTEIDKFVASDASFSLGSVAALHGNTAVLGTTAVGAYVFTVPPLIPTLTSRGLATLVVLLAIIGGGVIKHRQRLGAPSIAQRWVGSR